MTREELATLLMRRKDKLRQQLIRRYNNEDLVDDAISYSIERLMLRPHLFNPEKGIFNTYFWNLSSNYCKTEGVKRLKSVSFDRLGVENKGYYDSIYQNDHDEYHEWLAGRYPELQDSLIYNPDEEVDPYAEEVLANAVKEKLAHVNEIHSLLTDRGKGRSEQCGVSTKESFKLKQQALTLVYEDFNRFSPQVIEWYASLIKNK